MADKSDGRIVIDTELDNSGFEKDSEKLQKATDSLTKSIESMASAAVKPMGKTENIDRYTDSVREASKALQDAKDSAGGVGDDTQAVESAELEKAAVAARRAVRSLSDELDRMGYASMRGFSSTQSVLSFSRNIDEATKRLDDAKESLKEFAAQEIPTDEYKYTQEAIDKAEKALLKLYDRQDMMQDMGVDENSKQWQRLQIQIRAAEEELERYEMDADRMRETGMAFIDPASTQQFRKMTDEIERQEKALEINKSLISQEAIEQARLNVQLAQERVATAANSAEREKAIQELQAAQVQLQAAASQSITPKVDAQSMSGWERFKSVLDDIGSKSLQGLRASAGVVKTLFSGISKAASGAASMFRNITSGARSSGASVNSLLRGMRSIKQMLISRIKQSFISYLSNTITESIKALAKFDARFDLSVSNLRNRTSELGANLTVSLGSLIRQIEPIITSVIDAVSHGVEKLNALIAMLRGESTMQIAARQTESYAQSLDNANSEADKLRKSQNKLNLALTSYDEIHKLDAETSAEASTLSAADAEKQVFQTVPVQSILDSMSDFGHKIVENLKTAIAHGEWETVGTTVGELINGAIDKALAFVVDFREPAQKVAEAIARALNGMIVEIDAEKLGTLFAEGVNTAFGVLKSFIDNFNFAEFGAQIGRIIMGFFEHVDWALIGQTLAAGFSGAIDALLGLLENLDPEKIAESLSTLLNNFVENVDWQKLGHTISLAVVKMFDLLATFLEETDWEDIGRAFKDFLGGIDWDDIVSSMSSAMGAAVGSIGQFLKGVFEDLPKDSENWGEELFDEYGEQMGDDILAAMSAPFVGIDDWIKDNIFTPFMTSLLKAFGVDAEGEDAQEFIQLATTIRDSLHRAFLLVFPATAPFELLSIGKNIADGIKTGTSDEFSESEMKPWCKKNLLDHLVSALEKIFDINSPSKVMKKYGGYIGDGILDGVSDVFTNLTSWVDTNIVSPIKNGLTNALNIVGDKARSVETFGKSISNGIKSGVSTSFENMKSWVSTNVVTPLEFGLTTAFDIDGDKANGVTRFGTSIANGIESGISTQWSSIDTFFEGKQQSLNEAGSKMSGMIGEGIKSGWQSVTEALGEKIDGVKNINTSSFVTAGENLITGLKNGITGGKWDEMVAKVWERFGNLTDWFNNDEYGGKSDFYDAGRNMGDGLLSGINAAFSNYEDGSIANIVIAAKSQGVRGRIRRAGTQSAQSFNQGFEDEQQELLKTVRSTAEATTAAFDDVSPLDAIIERLGTIAEIMVNIRNAFPDFSSIRIPDVAAGTLAPAKTRVTDEGGMADAAEIKSMLQRYLDRVMQLEETIASRPIVLQSTLEFDRQVIGRAVSEYTASSSKISNGNGGGW